jgi:hypothetical protein
MSLNQVSQENIQLPPEGVINGTFKSLNVNGVPIGGGGSGDLQTAYDNGNGIINTNAVTKPFTIQYSGVDRLVVGSNQLTIDQDIFVEGISNNFSIKRNTGFTTLESSTDLKIRANSIELDGTPKIETVAGPLLTIQPSTLGTALQALVSNGAGGVEFESVRTYNITWAGNAVTGSRWLIPKGNALTPGGTAGTFATTFYCPHDMTGSVLASSREVTGGSTTSVSFFNITAPATPIYTFTFTSGAEIVVPALTLVAGQTYSCIATDSVGGATIVMDLTFTID